MRGTQHDSILLHLGGENSWGVGGGWRCVVAGREMKGWGGDAVVARREPLKVQPVKYRHPLAKSGNISGARARLVRVDGCFVVVVLLFVCFLPSYSVIVTGRIEDRIENLHLLPRTLRV